jgi:coenzyme F420-reducing hydrogenase delta subunit
MNDFTPQIVGFYCENCASSAAKVGEQLNMVFPENVKMVRVPCTGRVEVLHLMKPFEEGAHGVYVAGCQEDSCQYISGITQVAKRIAHVKEILADMDIEPSRVELFHLSAAGGRRFVEIAHEMTNRIRSLGPDLYRREPAETTR